MIFGVMLMDLVFFAVLEKTFWSFLGFILTLLAILAPPR
jgi:hypothetical protein